jgi:hypothetical protein
MDDPLEGASMALRYIKAPRPMSRFDYFMWWHPRMNGDAAYIWLRNVVRQVAESL